MGKVINVTITKTNSTYNLKFVIYKNKEYVIYFAVIQNF